jgi:formamidopyrimidine-DNA glycosylase
VPEGDTVFLSATRLHTALAQKKLSKSDFRVPRYATVDLAGRTVAEVTSLGKHMLWRFDDDLSLHTHFKMEGSWHLYRAGARWRAPGWQARLVLATHEWTAVGFNIPVIDLVPRDDEKSLVAHLGPDPLRNWDAEEALRRLASDPDRPFSDAIVDQRNIAGLGNVFKCEICFLRGVNPWTRVGDAGDLRAAVDLAKSLMDTSIRVGTRVTTGDARPGYSVWVYGRRNKPCRRCGAPVQRRGPASSEDQVTYWCPNCQPGLR